MRKVLGFTLALLLTLTLTASAEQAAGRIMSVNSDEHTIVFDDGTKLWVADGYITNLMPGDQVLVMYETKGEKKTITSVSEHLIGRGLETPEFGIQAAD